MSVIKRYNNGWEAVGTAPTSDVNPTSGHIIVELSTGVWSGDAPVGRVNGQSPILFVSQSDPADPDDGIPSPGNIQPWDVWLPTSESVGDPGDGGDGGGSTPGSGNPDVTVLSSQDTDTSMWDQNNGAGGTFSNVLASGEGIPAYTGSRVFKASVTSGSGNKYARGVHIPSPVLGEGDDFWWGGAFYLPSGTLNNIQEHLSLMGWDAYVDGNADAQGRLQIVANGDLLIQRGSQPYGIVLQTSGFDLPEDEWFWIEVREVLSGTDGEAINEIWVNDNKIAENTASNLQTGAYPSNELDINRLRMGIVSINSSQQTNALTVYCDRLTISRSERVGGL